jgi:hypothetical protein
MAEDKAAQELVVKVLEEAQKESPEAVKKAGGIGRLKTKVGELWTRARTPKVPLTPEEIKAAAAAKKAATKARNLKELRLGKKLGIGMARFQAKAAPIAALAYRGSTDTPISEMDEGMRGLATNFMGVGGRYGKVARGEEYNPGRSESVLENLSRSMVGDESTLPGGLQGGLERLKRTWGSAAQGASAIFSPLKDLADYALTGNPEAIGTTQEGLKGMSMGDKAQSFLKHAKGLYGEDNWRLTNEGQVFDPRGFRESASAQTSGKAAAMVQKLIQDGSIANVLDILNNPDKYEPVQVDNARRFAKTDLFRQAYGIQTKEQKTVPNIPDPPPGAGMQQAAPSAGGGIQAPQADRYSPHQAEYMNTPPGGRPPTRLESLILARAANSRDTGTLRQAQEIRRRLQGDTSLADEAREQRQQANRERIATIKYGGKAGPSLTRGGLTPEYAQFDAERRSLIDQLRATDPDSPRRDVLQERLDLMDQQFSPYQRRQEEQIME